MPKGYSVDLDDLHRYLFVRADRLGRLKISQIELAEEFGLTKFTMSRTFAKMIDQERIRLLTKNKNHRGTFVVEDPEAWKIVHGE